MYRKVIIKDSFGHVCDDDYQDKFTDIYLDVFSSVYRERYDREYQNSLATGCSELEADDRARTFATERAHERATESAVGLIHEYMAQRS